MTPDKRNLSGSLCPPAVPSKSIAIRNLRAERRPVEQPGTIPDGVLSSTQQKHLLGVMKHADQMLTEIEHILDSERSSPLIARHTCDFAPPEAREIRSGIAELRAHMAAILEQSGIQIPEPHIGGMHTIASTLDYIDIELEELQPRAMRAYGEVSPAGGRHLETTVRELKAIVRRILSHARPGKPAR